jgi:hypothetical protein
VQSFFSAPRLDNEADDTPDSLSSQKKIDPVQTQSFWEKKQG